MTLANTLVNTSLARARDPQGIATTQTQALQLTSISQQVVNGMVGDVIVTASLLLQPCTAFYDILSVLSDCLEILTIRDASGRELSWIEGDLDELASINLSWPFATSSSPRCWSTAGRGLLLFYPTILTPTTVTVVYNQITPALTSLTDTTVVQDETDDAILTLNEALLLLKAHDYAALKAVIERLKPQIETLRQEER